MTPTGRVLRVLKRSYHSRVADFVIQLIQSMDLCILLVRISAGNSAGLSLPSETAVFGKLEFNCDNGLLLSFATLLYIQYSLFSCQHNPY